jgi:hypothetical protein
MLLSSSGDSRKNIQFSVLRITAGLLSSTHDIITAENPTTGPVEIFLLNVSKGKNASGTSLA